MTTQCDTPDFCHHLEEVYGYEILHLTVRESTPEERKPGGVGNFWLTDKPMRAKKYVVVDAETGDYLGAFGLTGGGATRKEAVFWAERWASKNGGHFIRPDGWENVVGALPAAKDGS